MQCIVTKSSCGSGICTLCDPNNPDCELAECRPKSPVGYSCSTDLDCASLDGNQWKCVGSLGNKNCVLPCAGEPCKACLSSSSSGLRNYVFNACKGGSDCKASVYGLNASEMLQDDFLDALLTPLDTRYIGADLDVAKPA